MGKFGDFYEIYAHRDSLNSLAETEGSNCLRVAGVSLINLGLKNFLIGKESIFREVGFTERAIYSREKETGTSTITQDKENFIDNFSNFIGTFLENRIKGFRTDSWEYLLNNLSDDTATFIFVFSSLVSDLERESLIAAVSLKEMISKLGFNWHLNLARKYSEQSGNENFLTSMDYHESSLLFNKPRIANSGKLSLVEFNGRDWFELCTKVLINSKNRLNFTSILAAIHFLVDVRISQAFISSDSLSREIAISAVRSRLPESEHPLVLADPDPNYLSIMIHGTAAFTGDWWCPGGDFFDYAKQNVSQNLYSGGKEFSWSGWPSRKNLKVAGEKLARWGSAGSSRGLDTVFAHSYGADVSARAIVGGFVIRRNILLSAPVTKHVDLSTHLARFTIDIRVRYDWVLHAAFRPQDIGNSPNVTKILGQRNYWDHSVTHTESFWNYEGIAQRIPK